MEQITPEKKKEYLHTTTVPSWLILSAVLVLLSVFIFWAFTGNMLQLQKIKIITVENGTYGYVNIANGQPAKLRKQMEVVFYDGGKGTIQQVDHYVYTLDELTELFGSSLVNQLDAGNLNVLFLIEADHTPTPDSVQDGWVIMGEIKPIHLWFSGAK